MLVQLDTSAEEAQLASARGRRGAGQGEPGAGARSCARAESTRPGRPRRRRGARQAGQARRWPTCEAIIAKKTIRAPFDGRISIRQVELGPGRLAGDAHRHAASRSTPIYADFWLPQQALADLKVGQEVRLQIDTFPGTTWEGDGHHRQPRGRRRHAQRPRARHLPQRGRPAAPGHVRQRGGALAGEAPGPARSRPPRCSTRPYGDSVFVHRGEEGRGGQDARSSRSQQFVRLGERRGDFVAVVSGLKAGETVVSSGAFKLRNGMRGRGEQRAGAQRASSTPKPDRSSEGHAP